MGGGYVQLLPSAFGCVFGSVFNFTVSIIYHNTKESMPNNREVINKTVTGISLDPFAR